MECATWVLVCTTIGLFAATVVLAFSTWRYTTATKKLVKTERLGIVNDVHRRIHERDVDGWIDMEAIDALTGLRYLDGDAGADAIKEFREKLSVAYKKLMDDMLKDI